jgi:hypothetical protein
VKYSEFLIHMDSHDNIMERAGGEEGFAYKLACLLSDTSELRYWLLGTQILGSGIGK